MNQLKKKLKQSKKLSFAEALLNTVLGYIINIFAQMVIFPLFGIEITLKQNLLIGIIFFVISIVRGYIIRRIFNKIKNVHNSSRGNKSS